MLRDLQCVMPNNFLSIIFHLLFIFSNLFLNVFLQCLLKCTLQEEGIVSLETGMLDDIGAAFYFEETFAQEVRDIALPIAQGCFALAGTKYKILFYDLKSTS